jgi:hypothetical protein
MSYGFEHRGRGPDREVLLRWSNLCAGDVDRDPPSVPPFRSQGIGQVYETEQGLDAVKAIAFPREHAEEQVDLGQG